MRVKRSTATVASAVAATRAAGIMLAPSAMAKSKGYYDLGSPVLKNFHGRNYFNDGAYIGDSISGWTAGSDTSCTGFNFCARRANSAAHSPGPTTTSSPRTPCTAADSSTDD